MNVVELCGIATCVPGMITVLENVRRFAEVDAPILVEGETGTGKELVSRALHVLSPRARQPLITTDCAALAESVAESELFGHERGAFTGADRFYAGRLEAAAGGTVVLDEVNSLSLAMQGKLLRFLETKEILRLGQARTIVLDVRVVAASNAHLEGLVGAGQMRADFFHRLSVLRIRVPPLRERLADLPLLVNQFLAEDRLAAQFGVREVSDGLLDQLAGFSWPGNVRELRNLLRRAIAVSGGGPVLRHLGRDGDPVMGPREVSHDRRPFPNFRAWIREREREYFADLIQRFQTTVQQSHASALPQRTLYRKIRNLGVEQRRLLVPKPEWQREAAIPGEGFRSA